MTVQKETPSAQTTAIPDYQLGFNAAIKAALHAAAAGARRGDDSREMCVRAQIIEAIGGLKP